MPDDRRGERDEAGGLVRVSDTAAYYSSYLIFLAAIAAVAGFIGLSIIGAGAFGISLHVPLPSALGHMAVNYLLSLVAVFMLALIVNALGAWAAPRARSAHSSWGLRQHGRFLGWHLQMEQAARKMEESGKRMEAAQKAGDGAAAAKAMGDMAGAMAGGAAINATPIAAQDLKTLLPESLGELKREPCETQGSHAMGWPVRQPRPAARRASNACHSQ